MTRPRVLVVGSSNTDFIMGLERLPREGETVTDGRFSQTYGGKGANQAVAAARAGGEVTFISGIGDDAFGAQMLENFARDGIETRHIVRVPNLPSGSALVMFDRQGRNYLAVSPGANHAVKPEHLSAALFAQTEVVVLQMELPADTTRRALELAGAARKPVVWNFAPAHSLDFPLDVCPSIIVVNDHEAAALCRRNVENRDEAFAAARELRGRGPHTVLVTLGALGVVAASPEGESHFPAFPVEALDSTAAGDTFCGAFAVAWTQTGDLQNSLKFAGAAAALSVTRAGAQPSIPLRAEIEAFLAQTGGGRPSS